MNYDIYYKKKNLSSIDFYSDLFFFISIVVFPTSVFGLINRNIFYRQGLLDLTMLCLLLSIPYFLLFLRNIFVLKKYNWGKLLLWLVLYEIINIFISIINGIPIKEIITISRNFISPISTLGFVLYVISIDKSRIIRLIRWIVITMLIQGIFYIIFLMTGVNIFSEDIYMDIYISGDVVYRYFLAYPLFNYFVFAVSFCMVFYIKEKRLFFSIVLIISSFSMLLVSTRSVLIVFLTFSIISLFIYFAVERKVDLRYVFIFIAVLFSIYLIFSFFFEGYLNYFLFRFTDEFLYGKTNLLEASTFEYRISLINMAYDSLDSIFKLLFGNGFIRYKSIIGRFDLALQGDTPFAAVLYAEGFLGLIFRMLPILSLLILNIKNIKTANNRSDKYINILIISFILSELLNIIQTTIFQYYNQTMLLLFIVQIYYLKSKKELSNE